LKKDKQWLRKYYLDQICTKELLHAIDTFDIENIFNIEPIKQDSQQVILLTNQKLE